MKSRTVWASAGFALAVFLMQTAAPAIAGPFSDMAGSWLGSGVLYRSNGQNERLRCVARYGVGRDGDQINLSIRCTGDSYKFDLTGYILNNGGAISGQWSEPNYNSAGTLTGHARVGNLSANAIGNTFSAGLSVTTKENLQSVTVQPEGTDVTKVVFTLRRN
jgi:hypothetical protein